MPNKTESAPGALILPFPAGIARRPTAAATTRSLLQTLGSGVKLTPGALDAAIGEAIDQDGETVAGVLREHGILTRLLHRHLRRMINADVAIGAAAERALEARGAAA